MALVSMKMDKEEAKESTQPVESDAPKYPYGLELRLDDKALEKMGITKPPEVGASMTITAKVVVTSASSYQTQGGEAEASSCWQITDMEVAGNKNTDAKTLYPNSTLL